MKTTPFLLFMFILALALTACSDAATNDFEPVQGEMIGVVIPTFDDAGNVVSVAVEAEISGDLVGSASADLVITSADQDGTVYLTGGHTVLDANGGFLFTTVDQALTRANGEIENTMNIVEGAEGQIETTGTVNMETGELRLDYEGSIRF